MTKIEETFIFRVYCTIKTSLYTVWLRQIKWQGARGGCTQAYPAMAA